MNEIGWVSTIAISTLFFLTALLAKIYKKRPFLKYLPCLLVFFLSFFGILAGAFWLKDMDGSQLSFWSTVVNFSSLMTIIISVFLDLFTEMH
ncbi:hypothetical protein [Priestia abyssalis]|uniref:hypothetical protein n=1 Tax=Priestia abyssalis TaxID=1221450 RepID=UPI000995CEB5|nr:hypothetical protein [Priestia abyssalis]